MPTKHTVKQGECLSSIAAMHGFSDYRVIYDHPDNAELKKKRPNPNLIYPGDVLAIPDRATKEVDCAAGSLHRFKLKTKKTELRLDVQVKEPHHYAISIGEETFKGTTDGKAPIEHPIPATATSGRIELWPATDGNEEAKEGLIAWDLGLGQLDPIEQISGVQGRLANLGYYRGSIDGNDGADLGFAIASFESDAGLEPKGAVDDDTMRKKLAEIHDG